MVTQSFRPTIGGAELQLERLLPHLAAQGIRAEVLTRAVPGRPRRESIKGGDIRRTILGGESPLTSLVYVAGCLAHIARRRADIDVVHAHGALSPGTIALGARLMGLSSIVTVLGAGRRGDLARLGTKPGGRLRLRLLTRFAWFIALNAEIKRELSSKGVPGDRIFVIPNGVDHAVYRAAKPSERTRLRAELGIPAGAFIGIFVGRLHPVKRVDTLLTAAIDVPEIQLLILGDGRERVRLEALSQQLGVGDRVRFVGFTDRVADFLRASDCFLLPSRGEGMSNALIEAMSCGLPCVATSTISGMREVLGEGRGILMPPEDISAWANTMSRLAREPELRRRLGQAASEFVRGRFSLDAVADMIVGVYDAMSRQVGRYTIAPPSDRR
jgi:glycosyltransferase involved in cell wall biosynthesis